MFQMKTLWNEVLQTLKELNFDTIDFYYYSLINYGIVYCFYIIWPIYMLFSIRPIANYLKSLLVGQ